MISKTGADMSNLLSRFLKKKLLKRDQNLISINDPYEVISRLLADRTVSGIIDAGASDGHISKRLLRKFPGAHVYAFEPNLFYREELSRFANEEPRFHPFFSALSDCEGATELYMTQSLGNVSLFSPSERLGEISPAGASVKNLTKVDVVTIDKWAKRNGNIPIQLIKLDIQAAELKALQGAVGLLRSSVLLVYTEIWFNPAYEGGALYSQIDSFFRQNDFELYDIFKPGYDKQGRIIWANAVYIHSKRLSPKAISWK
jgi:FkbM family methyltransferase